MGLALHMYAQDFGDFFPYWQGATAPSGDTHQGNVTLAFNLLTGLVDGSGNPRVNQYITAAKVFLCPSSTDSLSPTAGLLVSDSCSYAYAMGFHQQTNGESVIVVDKKSTSYGAQTNNLIMATSDAHGTEGVNALYVRGNAKWISSVGVLSGGNRYFFLRQEDIPNALPWTLHSYYPQKLTSYADYNTNTNGF
ncbi:MAG: hypothetical protein NC824_06020 [Candidatus Omnitrophica bacterium]|nr:hypothetical protein [Candidatus Omnitrophota bacterium]